jgi:hypothetical protein
VQFPASQSNSGPFWVGSGLAFVSAIIAFFLIPEAKTDGMTNNDADFRQYLSTLTILLSQTARAASLTTFCRPTVDSGYDVSNMGLGASTDSLARDSIEHSTAYEKSSPVAKTTSI